jgi:hypothetical protein
MPFRRSARAALAGACLWLAACGDSTPVPPRCTPAPTVSPATVVAGPLTARTDRGLLPSGGALGVSLDVTGPAGYRAPCASPLQIIVVDKADIHVAAQTAPAPKGTPCGTVTLAAGQTAHYEVIWTADATLPPGQYRVVATLGDQPAIALPVELGARSLNCG